MIDYKVWQPIIYVLFRSKPTNILSWSPNTCI